MEKTSQTGNQQVQLQSELVIPPQKIHINGLWIFTAIILMLIIGSGGVYLGIKYIKPAQKNQTTQISKPQISPTPAINSTANWKTYIDSVYNFTMKYPPELTMNPFISKDNKYEDLTFSGKGIISITIYSQNIKNSPPI